MNDRHGGTSRWPPGRAVFALAAGVVLTTASAVVACRAEPAPDFGAPSVAALASPSSPESGPSAGSTAVPRVPVRDGALPAVVTDAPVRLRIPALDLDAAVDAVGIDAATGDFAVPPGVDRVGWYRFGPGLAARTGSIVVAGHVDSAAEGAGAFFRLNTVEAGDLVTLTGPGGRNRTFTVTARERHRKTAVPLGRYFARDGGVRLTLITCGGPFDTESRHYQDNVVVTAVPVDR
jgi:hypothetical protein